jgi:putative transcription antitermination factor YqgF
MKVLGIDYGLHNLGFAIAETPYATPYSVAHVQSLQEAVAQVAKIVDAEHPDHIVVGIPEGEIARHVELFVETLRPLFGLEVRTHEETLSTKEAVAKLRQVGASRKKMGQDHAYAACLILEDYLESNPSLVKV